MAWSSLGDVDADAAHLEALVDLTPGVDPWCSGPDWVLPAHAAFSEESTPLLWAERDTGAALLSVSRMEDGAHLVAGLEPLWGFASPLLGPNLPHLGEFVCEHLRGFDRWDVCMFSGLPLSEDLARAMARPFSSLGEVRAVYGIVRQVADLRPGYETWFSGRSAKFRKALRQAERRARAVGIEFVDISDDPRAYRRCVDVETASWKGMTDDGIVGPNMHRFYEVMTERLQRTGRFRATIATLDGADVGFVFGGVRNRRYRGLQLSFAEEARHLSVSHLLQLHTIKQLLDEGIDTYDMGMDMEYKQRWATHSEPSMSLIVHRPAPGRRRRIG